MRLLQPDRVCRGCISTDRDVACDVGRPQPAQRRLQEPEIPMEPCSTGSTSAKPRCAYQVLALLAMKISIASSSTPARPMVWLRFRES